MIGCSAEGIDPNDLRSELTKRHSGKRGGYERRDLDHSEPGEGSSGTGHSVFTRLREDGDAGQGDDIEMYGNIRKVLVRALDSQSAIRFRGIQ